MFTPIMIGLLIVAAVAIFFSLRKDLRSSSPIPEPAGPPSKPVEEFSGDAFHKLVNTTPNPVVVLFHSPSCPSCQQMKPHFQATADTFGQGVTFIAIDVSVPTNKPAARRLGIKRIPMVFVFRDSTEKPLATHMGVLNRNELQAFIKGAIK